MRIKEQETHLILHEHDDDDDDEIRANRGLHNEELCDLYFSPIIIRVIR